MWILLAFLLLTSPALAQTNGAQVVAKTDVTVSSSATLVLTNNTFRFALSCTNTSSTDHVRWGDATVTATSGQRIPAGASIEINNRGAVYMISEGGDVEMSCTEETR